jgi:hypothetical protein
MKRDRVGPNAAPATQADDDPILANDLLWGLAAIADYTGRTKRQAAFLIEKGKLPVKKLGLRTICARKSELDAAISSQD